MPPLVVGILGCAGSGKDTLALLLACKLGEDQVTKLAFADGIRDVLCDIMGIDYDTIEEWKRNAQHPPRWNVTMREGLQTVGEACRSIKPTVWIELLENQLKEVKTPYVLVTDVRHENEIAALRRWGASIVAVTRTAHRDTISIRDDVALINQRRVGAVHESERLSMRVLGEAIETGIQGRDSMTDTHTISTDLLTMVDYVLPNDQDIEALAAKAQELVDALTQCPMRSLRAPKNDRSSSAPKELSA